VLPQDAVDLYNSLRKGVQQSRASAPSCELSYDGVVT